MTAMERFANSIVVPVVVLDKAEDAVPTADAMLAGGIDTMEITFRTACASEAIKAVAENCPDVLVGTGTVLNLEQCKLALEMGAKFIVSPGFSEEVVGYCVEHGVAVAPGCVTPTEIMSAMKYGLKMVKFFPANVYGGLKAMKNLSAPFVGMKFLPTGGVNSDNIREYIDAPFIHAVGGSWVCPRRTLPRATGARLPSCAWTPGRPPRASERSRTMISYVKAGIVKWPMSVIRLDCPDRDQLVDMADKILTAWRGYSDPEAFIFAETDGEPHNTITPIARRRGADYELDLVLRNNITTEEHPLGVYHPHAELHHIKKENIGLIEVMGLAVLPSRLKGELAALEEAILSGADITSDPVLSKHAPWVEELKTRYSFTAENTASILREEVGQVFRQVLEHAGVYKRTESGRKAFLRFVDTVKQQT